MRELTVHAQTITIHGSEPNAHLILEGTFDLSKKIIDSFTESDEGVSLGGHKINETKQVPKLKR